MRDTQVEDVGEIDTCKEPQKDKIDGADCQSTQWSDVLRSKKYASQAIECNDEIANDVIYLHWCSVNCADAP